MPSKPQAQQRLMQAADKKAGGGKRLPPRKGK
jgi:hypothetical protein